MEWYAWIFLTLFILTSIAFILYIFLRPKDKSISDIKLKLEKAEEKARETKNELIKKGVENKNLQKQITEMELKELEEKHSVDLATLDKEERKKYEDIKQNPDAGINYIRDFLSK